MIFLYFCDTVIAVVLIIVLVCVVVVSGLLYWRWKKEQDRKEKRWIAQLDRANDMTSTVFSQMNAVWIYYYLFFCRHF